MEKVRYGIIGLGNQGNNYRTTFFEVTPIDNGVLTALCDINPIKIEAVKEKCQDKDYVYFTDYKEMLDSGLVDAILVETPHYVHPEIVIECLKRDIHVLCDKPAGVYTKQVREMNEFAKGKKALFGMMFNQRTNVLYREIKKIIESGGLGTFQRVSWIITDWFRSQFYYDSGDWRGTWAGEGGGVLFNQCPHQLDLIQWLIGEMPISVRGFCDYGKRHNVEIEDEVTAFFRYKNGGTGTFITSTGEAPGTNRLEIVGTLGKLVCENGKLIHYKNAQDSKEFIDTYQKAFGKPQFETIELNPEGASTNHHGICQNFTNAILGLEELFVSGEEGIKGVELMNAIELSGWKGGEEITLPINDQEYLEILNEKRANSKLKQSSNVVSDTNGTF